MMPPEDKSSDAMGQPGPEGLGGSPLFREDPELAGELQDLLPELEAFESLRPSKRVATVVRARALRRDRRLERNLGAWKYLWNLELALGRSAFLRLGLGLVLLMGAFLLFLGLFSRLQERAIPWEPGEAGPALGTKAPPVRERLEKSTALPSNPLESLSWIHSNNDLRMLRFLLRRRAGSVFSVMGGRASGLDSRSRRRIEVLAKALVGFLESSEQELEEKDGKEVPPYQKVEDCSLALKALLASGSTTRRGPHAAWVRKLLDRTERWLPRLHGPSLAVALGAYLEGALITNGRRVRVLSEALRRFTREQAEGLRAREGAERLSSPGAKNFLGTWASPLGALAEAGLLLRLAPALSAPPEAANRLRQAFLQHLLLRTHAKGYKGVHARAALLFGYGDLVDPEAIRKGLVFFERNPSWLGTDSTTLYHLSWSLFPPKRGWARFEGALRKLIAGATPASLREASILLLSQTVYLAPYLGGR
ncbi:MAG TPA: hypothetical protein ENK02_04575 [Planctomycetes bacterium]|nr:hypothetical protein [Planctomycetota bacterium]